MRIVFLLLLLVFFVGCTASEDNDVSSSEPICTEAFGCIDEPYVEFYDHCRLSSEKDINICLMDAQGGYRAIAKKNLDPSFCHRLFQAVERDRCISNIALETDDLDLCFEINFSSTQLGCRRRLGDVSLCDGEDDYYHCLYRLSVDSKKIGICKLIPQDSSHFTSCISVTSRVLSDIDHCFDFEGQAVDNCIFMVAEENLDLSLCDEILDPFQVDACKSSIARKIGDVNVCDQLSDKDGCIFGLVSENFEVEYCFLIDDLDLRLRCVAFIDFYHNLSDDYVCSTFVEGDSLATCTALVTDNPALCEDISYALSRKRCRDYFEGIFS